MSEDTPDDTNVIDPTPVDAQSTPEQDPTPTPDSDDAAKSTEPSQDDPKEPSRAEKRIQQLVGDRNHAMEYGDFWKGKYEQSQQAAPTPKEDKPAPGMPKLADFDYDEDAYAVSKQNYDDWHIDKKVNARVAEVMKQTGQTTATQKLEVDWQARANDFAKEHVDFKEVVSNPAFHQTSEMAEIIKTSENGPELAYHLGQNLAEAQRIADLPSSLQAFELGKLDLSSKPAVAQKQVTSAPDPMSPVGGGQPTLSTANETMDDFMDRRNAEDAAARKTRGTGRV